MSYVLGPAAQADLDEIWDYTAGRWDRVQANRYVTRIRLALDDLAEGRRFDQPAGGVLAGYRRYLVGSHVIFMRDHRGAAFEVVRILHQGMDAGRHLG